MIVDAKGGPGKNFEAGEFHIISHLAATSNGAVIAVATAATSEDSDRVDIWSPEDP